MQPESKQAPLPEPYNFDALAQEAYETWAEDSPNVVAVDTETTGKTFHDSAFGATVAWQFDGVTKAHYFELTGEAPEGRLRTILYDTKTWVFHNAKFDLQKLIAAEIIKREWCDQDDRTIHDTEAIAHLLDENQVKRLKDLAIRHLGWDDTIEVPLKSDPTRSKLVSREKYELDEARKETGKELGKPMSQVGFHEIPRAVLVPYALQDARMTLLLFRKLYPQLEVKDEELRALYAREMELALVLLDIETAGLGLDTSYVETKTRDVAREMFKRELEIRKITGREEFVDHHEWIRTAFQEQGIKIPNTQKATLAEFDHPLSTGILEYRKLKKLHSTYLRPMQDEQRDGILHPGFRQHGTRTGRMSSGGVQE